ncbi:Uncharacterized membrane protein YeiB [Oceanospirillum multiglobuliferum]|uniref:DUF418 domain-containing protein n=1 Tax=Oceanospirillum multiglobuliferum TaxID=64969 RepID=A0A1T4S7X3_9GAMM|nr:DUF418 domain-containing protein [Oceanospirillum multiglobuliferum]OPX54393.1 hypothetical protein BTE48_14270 [Oceanospirillum multiglobuliferum]SKA24292.1 Uncharacterized membrane protein YeiB [Oceanospirillum multiglobuliferum]
MKKRVTGFDLARALAIFGMVIVNFKIAMNAETGNLLLIKFAGLFEGRASALFVILAGVGVTFLTNKARESSDGAFVLKNRLSLIKRGLLLIAIGLLYTPIWEADILHFYGFYFLIAAAIFTVKDKALLIISAVIMLIFPVLMLFLNYEQNWNWSTLTYENLWSFDGMIRHIVFNGFHPVFPWAAFLIFGMWLGRQDLSQSLMRKKLLAWSLITLLVTEFSFYLIRVTIGDGSALEMTSEEVTFLFSTSIIPPLPQYIISAGSSAVVVLIACLYFSDRFSESNINKWLYKTGQLSLTLYVAHVIIGMGTLESIGRLENQTINFSLLSALIFCVCGIVFSVVWLKFFKAGPLEWVFRKLAS